MSSYLPLPPLQRVRKDRPCPICGKPDWCSVSQDGAICICMRVEEGSLSRARNGGFLHRLTPFVHRPSIAPRGVTIRTGNRSDKLAGLMGTFVSSVDPVKLDSLADALGVSGQSLRRLSIGWSDFHHAWAFPMVDPERRVCGIRLRSEAGRKWAIKGSHDGLFIPAALPNVGPLLVCEGPTDTAAALDLGFDAVGRPSCVGGLTPLVELVPKLPAPEVVIVADRDGPGLNGARSLASVLVAYAARVRIVTPPEGVKDLRGWKQAGATPDLVRAAINAAALLALSVNIGAPGAGRSRR